MPKTSLPAPNPRRFVAASVVLLAGLLGACSHKAKESAPRPAPSASARAEPVATATEGEVNPRLLRRFQPLTDTIAADGVVLSEAKVRLGSKLYHDTRLSKSGTQSCNSCHRLDAYGVDNLRTSPGAAGKFGGRNSPSVYNSAASFLQFWDGRAPTVEEQAKGPILNAIEMGMPTPAGVVAILNGIPGYVAEFKEAFPGEATPLTYDNLGRAIGAFERKLVTPGRWDKYLAGDKTALTSAEKEGLKTFLNLGCMVCHTGRLLGGSMFERVGVVEPWPNQSDPGRSAVTGAEGDRMMFKVPSLRNVEKTAPYFHDGSVATLDAAVKMMGKHQLGLDLSPAEVGSIVTWLNSLTGELPTQYITTPELPPSGKK